jgi:enoyl-CoA hydratase
MTLSFTIIHNISPPLTGARSTTMPVTTEIREHVLLISLDRPAKRNAMNREMTLGLDEALNRLDDDDSLWTGVLSGLGGAFSAGSDLAGDGNNRTERGGPYGLCGRARAKPLIAAVEGIAYGGGFEMVLSCDLIVASRSARFALPEVKRGLLALYGGVFRGAHVLPLNIAREMLLTGDPLGAARAEALGLVNILCDDGAALDQALALAGRINANGPVAVRESLRALNRAIEATDTEAWRFSDEAAARVRESEDSREGVAAFLAKRPPQWRGR